MNMQKCQSPLTDHEILLPWRNVGESRIDYLRKLVNIAHKEAIKQVCNMPPVSHLDRDYLASITRTDSKERANHIEEIIIGQFLADLKNNNGL